MSSEASAALLPRSAPRVDLPLAGIALAFLVLLVFGASQNTHVLNPDGVSYLRIAHYWAHGESALMISGYWGPLLSWLMVPLIWLGDHPSAPGRFAMLVSALVFLWGTASVLRRLGIPRQGLLAGSAVAAAYALPRALGGFTPDLLLGGFLALGLSRLLDPHWPASLRVQLGAGAFFGVAYYAKAVAFPLTIGTVLGFAVFSALVSARRPLELARAALVTLAAFLGVAAPWLLTLSLYYGHPTFSESGGINHALVGPVIERNAHPYRYTFHVPEEGRLSAWEDPTVFEYPGWSPLDNAAHLRHQLRLVDANFHAAQLQLREFDLLGLAFFATIAGFLFHAPWLRRMREERWRWAFVPVIPMVLIYLPVFANKPRYFYGCFPLLLAGFLGMAFWVLRGSLKPHGRERFVAPLVVALTLVLFVTPVLPDLARAMRGHAKPEMRAAMALAERLEAEGLSGSVAGSGHTGLFLAYLIDEPFMGDLTDRRWTLADVEEGRSRLAEMPAALLLAPRDPELRAILEGELGYESLDERLFGQGPPAGLDIEVFRAPSRAPRSS